MNNPEDILEIPQNEISGVVEATSKKAMDGNKILMLKSTTKKHSKRIRNRQQKRLERIVGRQTYQAICKATKLQAVHTAETQAKNEALIQNQCKEKEHLIALYNETDTKFLDLVQRFNNLNDAYGAVVAENVDIKNSKTYRFAEFQKKIASKLHLIGPMKFVLLVRHVGLKEAIRQRKTKKMIENEPELLTTKIVDDQDFVYDKHLDIYLKNAEEINLWNHIQTREKCYAECVNRIWNDMDRELEQLVSEANCKGIVVYPHAVHWEPMQRPQHFLRSLARKGYLCFFCDTHEEKTGYYEYEKNLYIVYGEENLLPVLQNKSSIILVSYFLQSVFASYLPNKVIWFDVLDNQEFFSFGNTEIAKQMVKQLLDKATVVSYSADNLQKYVESRSDALKLTNGVYLEDFQDKAVNPISELERIKKSGKKVIGYYGAIEEWFDVEALEYLIKKTPYEIVLIGRQGIDLSHLKNRRVHMFGTVPYSELRNYSQYFDVALIPFVVNELTNSVSPVKFFEYAAQEIPVVSSNIKEMKQYAGETVKIYRSNDELVRYVKELCERQGDTAELRYIAMSNSWEKKAEQFLRKVYKTVDGLRTLANFDSDSCVSVLAVTFFKYDGTTYYSGGAERYLLDLHEVCKELNVPYRIYQYGEYDWVRFYDDVEVIGLGAKKCDVNVYTSYLIDEMEEKFLSETSQNGLLNIYSPFFILVGENKIPSIGISHGIAWDSEFTHFTDGNTFWQTDKNIIEGAQKCDHMISVDTNTCNWFQTIDYDIGHKIKYVPNYVDNEEFVPRENFLEKREKTVITYPRRMYGPRGLYVVLDIVDNILSRYPEVEFHFVGKGFETDTKHIEKKIRKWGDRIKWYSCAPNEMYKVYQETDISLIPTMYSEGTSLSCLEALSSGNAVIATRIGGLTDLILNGYNGYLVEPNGQAIEKVLTDLLDNPEKMKNVKMRAVETAKAFSKNIWKERWKESLREVLKTRVISSTYSKAKRCMISIKSVNDLENGKILETIKEYLCDGWYVYISCKNNPLKMQSYKRIQFIDIDEDVYFTPEKVLDSEIIISK